MPLTELKNEIRTVEVNSVSTDISTDNPRITQVLDACNIFHTWIAVDKITFELESGIKFKYQVNLLDGRKWKQDIFIPVGQEEYMTFNVSDQWKFTESSKQSLLREALITLIKFIPDVTKIEIDFI